MYKECEGCKSSNICSTAVQPRSVMCQMNRLRSGQTKAELEREKKMEPMRCCPYCGKLLNN